VQSHPALEWLDLGYAPSTRVLGCSPNAITGEAIAALAGLIASAPRLAELNLSRAGVGPPDLERLAAAAEATPGLMSVSYGGTRSARLDNLLAVRRARGGWEPPPRPDVALIRSVYR
jgi:hypothetical protein